VKKVLLVLGACLAAGTLAVAAASPPNPQSRKDNQPQLRSLQGQVMGHGDAPLPEAVVYLKNTKTLAIRTFIADQSANYQFNGLAPNVDYEIHAEYDGHKSDVKTLSSFDNRNRAYLNLHIPTDPKSDAKK